MSKSILCTLGPASMNDWTIRRLEELGVSLFRINLSHTRLKDVARNVAFLKERTRVPVCLDSEGAQVRTGDFVEPTLTLNGNSMIRVHRNRVPGDAHNFNLYPTGILDLLEVGDLISIDFNSVLVQVVGREDDAVAMRVLNGGVIGRNKAVTVERDLPMAPLTAKDRAAIGIGREMGVRHFALSFANQLADVTETRRLVGADAFLISKIESRNGLRNLEDIARASDAILIDRGDLSRQVPLERIPAQQKSIIRRVKSLERPVYVATNLLESMVVGPSPTRAEVNDVYNTLSDGADGLVLAAETAIGRYPVLCAGMIVKLIREFENPDVGLDGNKWDMPVSLLAAPHGGELVRRQAGPSDRADVERLPRLAVEETDLKDIEQIALGTFSPLTGFMDRRTLESVLHDHRLPSGAIWTLPLLLQVAPEAAARLVPGERVALTDATGTPYALLDVSETSTIDLESVARLWFGTDSREHPGVARLLARGPHVVAGDVLLLDRLPSPYHHYELTPVESRFIFTHKGWSKVVGFHSRNVVHRVHEHIQFQALADTGADGLFISPVIGPKKPGDFLPPPILKSYQILLDFGIYPRDKVVLGSFSTYSRYCGPREAVFTALCRKNMGCSHFIIGRDHTGVGSFYSDAANRALFDTLGDLDIAPVFFDAIGYDPETEAYASSSARTLAPISGTQVREALRDGGAIPEWFMRDEVQDMLRREIQLGRPVFHA